MINYKDINFKIISLIMYMKTHTMNILYIFFNRARHHQLLEKFVNGRNHCSDYSAAWRHNTALNSLVSIIQTYRPRTPRRTIHATRIRLPVFIDLASCLVCWLTVCWRDTSYWNMIKYKPVAIKMQEEEITEIKTKQSTP